MHIFIDNKFNLNPITKLFVVGLLGLTVVHSIHHYLEWAVIVLISVMYFIVGYRIDALKNLIVFGILFLAPNAEVISKLPVIIKFFLLFVFVLRMFYIPISAGAFFVKTSDVGSIISSMDALRVPNVISIPIAVMFRYFPSFKEESRNINMAMKIRGISVLNPIKYLEYVAVPLLIISSNISEDIAMAAETRCIENPIKKSRYIKVKVGLIDFIYGGLMLAFVVGGWLCLK